MSTLLQSPAAAISPSTPVFGEQAASPLRLAPSPTPHATLSRQQIIDATATCLKQEGYDGTTIRRIARELNCAVGSIYRYFVDKRQLLAAVTQQPFEPLAHAVQAGQPIEETVSEYRRLATQEPVAYRLMFWLASLEPDSPNALPSVIDRIVQGWARQMQSSEQAYNAWAYLHGIVTLTPHASSSACPTPTAKAPAAIAPVIRLAQPVRIEVPRQAPADSVDDVTML